MRHDRARLAWMIFGMALVVVGASACCGKHSCPTPNADTTTAAPAAVDVTSERRPVVTTPADTLHGHVIPDPYRWLEDFESADAQSWIAEMEAETREVLDAVPAREAIRERLAELFDISHIGPLSYSEDRLFLLKRDGDQEQSVLYVQKGLDSEPELLIDPDELGTGTPVTLDWWYPSADGDMLAYGTSVGGSENSTLRVMNVDTQEVLPDTIPRTRLASLAWNTEADAFYYTRFPAPGEVPEGEEFFHRKVYYHELGTDYRDDPMVFGHDLDMRAWTGVGLSTNDRFLLAYAFYGGGRNDLYVKDLEAGGGWKPIVEGLDSQSYGTAIGDDLYMLTTHDAPNHRLVLVDLTDPAEETWVELVPEGEHSIETFAYVNGHLLIGYIENAHERVEVLTDVGDHVTDVPFPDMVSLADWSGDWRHDDVFFNVHSYLQPPTILHYDIGTGESDVHMEVDAPIDTDAYVTKQVWYPSRDGTMISMFLVHKRDIELDGTNPTILTGYGGFAISTTPEFTRNRYLWLEHGGVYAAPNIRGGGEYGEEWHRSGTLDRKQNTFDDFIAAAEWLIEEDYTNPDRLAVWGGSNGGLLTTAFLTQRPDLAAAVIADVPLTDMTRFHLLYGGSIWISEYGDPEDPDDFEYLYGYSPYHMVVEGTEYPAVYLTTAETDTRVHPSHALKMAAKLRTATASDEPILLRYERQAGHGMGARMSTLLDEYVDYYAFLFRELGVE